MLKRVHCTLNKSIELLCYIAILGHFHMYCTHTVFHVSRARLDIFMTMLNNKKALIETYFSISFFLFVCLLKYVFFLSLICVLEAKILLKITTIYIHQNIENKTEREKKRHEKVKLIDRFFFFGRNTILENENNWRSWWWRRGQNV